MTSKLRRRPRPSATKNGPDGRRADRGRSVVVAIDGPAGAGKSTVAKRLAAALGYQVLDTGAIYRAVALEARRQGASWTDETRCAAVATALDIRFETAGDENRVFVDEREVTDAIRQPAMSEGASRVSAHPAVRDALLSLQRRLGQRGGVIAEGRDVGTVVFPDAGVKFFLTASTRTRAKRRYDELLQRGMAARLDQIEQEIRDRDERDSTRAVAPLVRADDAIELDSTRLGVDEVLSRMVDAVRAAERAAAAAG